jgi:acyl-CoA thioesterase
MPVMRLSDLWTTGSTWLVPDGWRQGRGAWGGLVTGQVVTAASHDLPAEDLVPRSVWVSMLAPVMAGPVQCQVVDLRVGTGTVGREVTLRGPAGELWTRAVVVFGVDRATTSVSNPAPMPPDPAPEPGAAVPLGPPLAPEFTSRLRFAPVLGLPFSGKADQLVTTGWVGLDERSDEPLTPAVVAALVDAWWTTSLVGLDGAALADGPPPVATLDFSLSFPQQPEPEPDVWRTGLWYTGRVLGGNGGYLTEMRTLHSPAGRLLAVNSQTQAIGRTGRR